MKDNVEYTKTAVKQFKKMDKKIAALIFSYIEDRFVGCKNPRLCGQALQSNWGNIWRYRVGNYRILAKIEDDKVLIIVVGIGHRREIYDS